jgi:hypothetical protein
MEDLKIEKALSSKKLASDASISAFKTNEIATIK